ncbi:MAG: hypothetical protein ACI89D_001210 [Bermanella sp.]|jgi:hypothetical protein
MTRTVCLLGLMVMSSLIGAQVNAQELTLHIAKNRIGFVQAYLENSGPKPVTVATANLVYDGQGDRVDIYPKPEYWQRGDKKILLKVSAPRYAPVTLEPGQITYLQEPNIRIVAKTVQYRVPADWGELHGIWSGAVEAQVHNK